MQMIKEFLIGKGIIRRTSPIRTEPIMDGIIKLQTKLQDAVEENTKLAKRMQITDGITKKQYGEQIKKMEIKMEKTIKAIKAAHEKKQEAVRETFNAEKTATNNTIRVAQAEAKKASIISNNITNLTTKRLATE